MKTESAQVGRPAGEASLGVLRVSPPPTHHVAVLGTLCVGSEPHTREPSESAHVGRTHVFVQVRRDRHGCLVLTPEKP